MRQSISSVARLLLFAAAAMIVLSFERQSTAGQQSEDRQKYQRNVQKYMDEMHAKVAKFQTAKNPDEAGKRCSLLFPTPFAQSARLLVRHDDPHVAIQAAWCRYGRKVRRRDMVFGMAFKTLDPRDVQRFLGFVEGRARVLVPEWWEKALADPDENLWRGEQFRESWVDLKEVVKKSDDSYVTMEIDSDRPEDALASPQRINVPAKTFRALDPEFGERLGVAIDGKHLVMMPHRSDAGVELLACVDRTQSKELWQAETWGLGEILGRSGPPPRHYLTMEIVEDRVFIFGATTQGAYVEVFALKDGTPLIRFATTNWFVKRPEK